MHLNSQMNQNLLNSWYIVLFFIAFQDCVTFSENFPRFFEILYLNRNLGFFWTRNCSEFNFHTNWSRNVSDWAQTSATMPTNIWSSLLSVSSVSSVGFVNWYQFTFYFFFIIPWFWFSRFVSSILLQTVCRGEGVNRNRFLSYRMVTQLPLHL